ncbi:MAG: hypothetical protein ACRYGP_06620 [Janthinobacterium lividum]
MSVFGNLISRLMPKARLSELPVLPEPRDRYVLVSSGDMIHFDLLDGHEECGGVELKPKSETDPKPWSVHVYGMDLTFATLGKARAWLGKPAIRME